MGSISLNKAEYLALFLETFIFGTFFTLCIIAIMIVLQSKNSRTPKFLLPVAVLMMVLAIGDLVIDFIHSCNAFVIAGTQSIGGAEVYFDNISKPALPSEEYSLLVSNYAWRWRHYVAMLYGLWSESMVRCRTSDHVRRGSCGRMLHNEPDCTCTLRSAHL
ncbi:hypothetical protein HETIRDRAFT_441931 [Heterobasidion irregulare TC 32-1]|uniref:Uncharacterized protein n=1 Tax=Heterobasidion irregulare (strain TC 32-1) TaxID=747525 RepID=W4JRX2_HETIT|nr:uncharacterized protein HETIRDRAFT_441931 [Heterobasidion irregulare TC 32-1]ETW76297.1 hypothetical protein HETIRDRAFT_441931 [Heterobasidion irregulare TC 32-1]